METWRHATQSAERAEETSAFVCVGRRLTVTGTYACRFRESLQSIRRTGADRVRRSSPSRSISTAICSRVRACKLAEQWKLGGKEHTLSTVTDRALSTSRPSACRYLFTEEARIHRRGWSENLTYYSGFGYLAGVFGGAGKGLSDGLKSKPETGIGTSRFVDLTGGKSSCGEAR